jgi:Na+/alanine symporter
MAQRAKECVMSYENEREELEHERNVSECERLGSDLGTMIVGGIIGVAIATVTGGIGAVALGVTAAGAKSIYDKYDRDERWSSTDE